MLRASAVCAARCRRQPRLRCANYNIDPLRLDSGGSVWFSVQHSRLVAQTARAARHAMVRSRPRTRAGAWRPSRAGRMVAMQRTPSTQPGASGTQPAASATGTHTRAAHPTRSRSRCVPVRRIYAASRTAVACTAWLTSGRRRLLARACLVRRYSRTDYSKSTEWFRGTQGALRKTQYSG